MKRCVGVAAAVLAAISITPVLAQGGPTWCGKNYLANQTVVPPGGQFPLPAVSTEPLVAFRCSPVFRPYLQEDAKNASFLVDTPIVYKYIQGASPISFSSSSEWENNDLGSLDVTISIDGKVFATGEVPVNTTGYEIPVDISSLVAQKTRHNVTCDATYQGTSSSSSSSTQAFSTNTTLLYLPNNNISVVKTDLRTGALWVRPADGSGGAFRPFIPQGIYIEFNEYLVNNLTILDQLKADGFNTIHAIPPFFSTSIFQAVFNRSIELGLYMAFDFRPIYRNLSEVTKQIPSTQFYPNLLYWETAYEPDGNSDPFNGTRIIYDLLYETDGYHPVSIVLNCQDYNFSPYIDGADIVLENAYPIGIDPTYSRVWNTSCTPDFGNCGCDNCQGYEYDVTARVQTFQDRLDILGYDRSKTVWSTPQAFGNGTYWDTTPTGQQWAAMQLTSYIHGATAAISFQYPITTGNETTIEGTAPPLTKVVSETVQPFIVNPYATRETFNVGGVDVGLWHNGTAYLFLGVNLNDVEVHIPWASVGLGTLTSNATSQIQRIFSISQNLDTTGFNFRPGGLGIYTVTPPDEDDQGNQDN